jgi:protein-disulfide isomerase
MIRSIRNAVIIAAATTMPACSTAVSPGAGGSEIAARIGDRAITVTQLEARWREADPPRYHQAQQALYDARRRALDDMVASLLIEEAATAKGLSPDDFVEGEIASRLRPVTDADVVAFHEQNRGRMQGRSAEQAAPAIRQLLTQQRMTAARRALIAALRDARPELRVMLSPPRVEIPVAGSDPSAGPTSALVTIVEFSDFACPFCEQMASTLKQVREKYGDKVAVVWKDFPLTRIHPQAFEAGEAARCAGDQQQYWEYHDLLFSNQRALQSDDLRRYAGQLGLDAARFDDCMAGSRHGDQVRAGMEEGMQLGVSSTPTLYINGRRLAGAQSFEAISAVVDEELLRQQPAVPGGGHGSPSAP